MSDQHVDVPSLTAHVAQFITATNYRDIPGEVQDLGKKAILDGLGVALSGSISAPGRIMQDYVRGLGCAGDCTAIGSNARLILPRGGSASASAHQLRRGLCA